MTYTSPHSETRGKALFPFLSFIDVFTENSRGKEKLGKCRTARKCKTRFHGSVSNCFVGWLWAYLSWGIPVISERGGSGSPSPRSVLEEDAQSTQDANEVPVEVEGCPCFSILWNIFKLISYGALCPLVNYKPRYCKLNNKLTKRSHKYV